MGTWIKETKKAIYWMEGDYYIDKVEKVPSNDGNYNAIITELKNWFNTESPPGTMVIVTDDSPEPTHKPIAPNHGHEHGDTFEKPPVKFISSPNFSSRNAAKIDMIIMHNTDGSFQSAINEFQRGTGPNRVSAHYIVARNGEIVQMVQDSQRAWHAGNSDVNARSIGIEHVADQDHLGLTPEQKQASIALVKFLMTHYQISLDNIKPHRDVSISGTDCPKWIWRQDGDFNEWKTANLA